MQNNIPEQIAYLAPVFQEIAQFPPEQLGDDNPAAMHIVESAVRRRVKGLGAAGAREAVQRDVGVLAEWVKTPDAPASAAFVYGSLMGMSMWADFDELSR
jgi:hypothetical protein